MKSIQEIEAGLELDSDEEILRAQLDTANSRIAELERQQSEPFGYFKAEPFGWTDCAETDDGAKALYERPDPRVTELERVQGVLVGALDYYATGNFGTSCGVAVDALAAVQKPSEPVDQSRSPCQTCFGRGCTSDGYPCPDCTARQSVSPEAIAHYEHDLFIQQKPEGGDK